MIARRLRTSTGAGERRFFSVFDGLKAHVHRHFCDPNVESDVTASAQAFPDISASFPRWRRDRLRRHEIHQMPRSRRWRRRCSRPRDRRVVIFMFRGNLRDHDDPHHHHPALAHRRQLALIGVGYSINLLSCWPWAGDRPVVDDAIAVVENIHATSRRAGSLRGGTTGSPEIAVQVISMTITLRTCMRRSASFPGITGAIFPRSSPSRWTVPGRFRS